VSASLDGRLTPKVIWLTGLSASGKTSIANALALYFTSIVNLKVHVLDGDELRAGLSSDLGFSDCDRTEHIRRVAKESRALLDGGAMVIVALISPFEKARSRARALIGAERFIEVFVDTPIEVCERRDTKGLYIRARKKEIKDFTGLDAIYEPPISADIVIKNGHQSLARSVEQLVSFLTSSAAGIEPNSW